jgi:hypothetical protein
MSVTAKVKWEMRVDIKSRSRLELLRWLYARERLQEQFTFHITNLINWVDAFADFIRGNQNRDSFMEVEADRHLQFRALYESCRMASLYLENEWAVEPLRCPAKARIQVFGRRRATETCSSLAAVLLGPSIKGQYFWLRPILI